MWYAVMAHLRVSSRFGVAPSNVSYETHTTMMLYDVMARVTVTATGVRHANVPYELNILVTR